MVGWHYHLRFMVKLLKKHSFLDKICNKVVLHVVTFLWSSVVN